MNILTAIHFRVWQHFNFWWFIMIHSSYCLLLLFYFGNLFRSINYMQNTVENYWAVRIHIIKLPSSCFFARRRVKIELDLCCFFITVLLGLVQKLSLLTIQSSEADCEAETNVSFFSLLAISCYFYCTYSDGLYKV